MGRKHSYQYIQHPLNETWGETLIMRHGEKHSYQYIQHPLNETWGETLISIHTAPP